MISNLFSGYLPPDKLIVARLFTVIIVYAALAFAGRRGWLKPRELMWVGGAVIFWAIAWLLTVVLIVVRGRYPALGTAVPMSLGLLVPLVVAMIFGLRFIIKRAANPAAPAESNRLPDKPRRKG